ncbi:MAG: TIGR00730 family Rossman fold protein [Chlamydiia bacterium]|nr:TIGR00730 family Rossman fold protein [Chlamydiia bacterium]
MKHDEVNPYFQKDAWRVFRIISEFVDGFERLTDLGPSVTVFGSSRIKPGSHYYKMGVEVSRQLTLKKFAIITGGGPGIMEAANKGAKKVGGRSCGVSIIVPHEKESNRYIDPQYSLKFRYFFVRKVMFIRYAQGYVFLPGGYGTLDELFEALTLIQTKKIDPFPIYLMGTKYWKNLLCWLKETALEEGCISPSDLDLFQLTNDPEEVAAGIEAHYLQNHTHQNF